MAVIVGALVIVLSNLLVICGRVSSVNVHVDSYRHYQYYEKSPWNLT